MPLRSRVLRPFDGKSRNKAPSANGSSLTSPVSPRPGSIHKASTSPAPTPGSSCTKRVDPCPRLERDAFEDLWDEALDEYYERTGVDLSDEGSDLSQRLQSCTTPDLVVKALEQIASDFSLYRNGSGVAKRIRSELSAVAHGVLVLVDIGAESAASMSFPGGKAIFVAIAVLIKATKGVSEYFDTLIAILQKFGLYLLRLRTRLAAGVSAASREIAVELLVKMLQTFALVTETMHKSRIDHFVGTLFRKEDKAKAVAQRVEQLMIEELRTDDAEIYHAVIRLSDEMQQLLALPLLVKTGLVDIRTDLQANTMVTRDGFATLSAQLSSLRSHVSSSMPKEGEQAIYIGSSGRDGATVPSQEVLTLSQKTLLADRVNAIESELGQMRLQQRVTPSEGRSNLLELRVAIPSLDPAVFKPLLFGMVNSIRDLTPEDQAALRQGIAMLYSIAATTVTAGAGNDILSACFAVWLNPAAVFAAFLPMAAVYVVAYLCWRRTQFEASAGIPRVLQDPHMEVITLIDVLGVRILLPLDRVSTWKDFHTILLHQFLNRDGAEYVKSQAYKVMDPTAESSFIEPQSWTQMIRAGMTLDMSIVVHRQLLGCPYCGTSTALSIKDGETKCVNAQCGRHYWTTSESESQNTPQFRSSVEKVLSAVYAGFGDVLERPLSSTASSVHSPAESEATLAQDMHVFRRITIVHSKHIPRSSRTPNASISEEVSEEVTKASVVLADGSQDVPDSSTRGAALLESSTPTVLLFNTDPIVISTQNASLPALDEFEAHTGPFLSLAQLNRAHADAIIDIQTVLKHAPTTNMSTTTPIDIMGASPDATPFIPSPLHSNTPLRRVRPPNIPMSPPDANQPMPPMTGYPPTPGQPYYLSPQQPYGGHTPYPYGMAPPLPGQVPQPLQQQAYTPHPPPPPALYGQPPPPQQQYVPQQQYAPQYAPQPPPPPPAAPPGAPQQQPYQPGPPQGYPGYPGYYPGTAYAPPAPLPGQPPQPQYYQAPPPPMVYPPPGPYPVYPAQPYYAISGALVGGVPVNESLESTDN